MNKKRIFPLLLVLLACQGATALEASAIDNMRNHCECIMLGGACAEDIRAPYAPDAVLVSRLGRITGAQAEAIRSKGPSMCAEAASACRGNSLSPGCIYMRMKWRQEPITCLAGRK